MKQLTKYLIVVSFDALSSLDFGFIKTLPHFNQFLEKASYSQNVISVYPSLTYPAHTSIVTGKYPKHHGVINNTLLQPRRSKPDWYWQRKYIQTTTFYDEAINKGLKVASLLWPVTAKSRIQYNMPEVFANRSWQNQMMVSMMNGSIKYQMTLNKLFGHLRKGIKQPYLDNFVHQSVLHTIKEKRPNLMLIHFTDLDTMRHRYGVHSKEAKEAMVRHDQRLGELLEILSNERILDQSTIVLLGDHSQLDESNVVYLNAMFRERGWIVTDKKERLKDWKVLVKNCDGSAYIYIKDKTNTKIKEEVRSFLSELAEKETMGIEKILTSDEAAQLGADPKCAFMLEAKKDYYFLDDYRMSPLKKIQKGEIGKVPHITAATHGYSPYKDDYTTVFMARGKGIKPGVVINQMNLVDEGPTLAKLLGITLENADGRVIEEILQD